MWLRVHVLVATLASACAATVPAPRPVLAPTIATTEREAADATPVIAAEPETIAIELYVPANTLFTFVRPPSVEVHDDAGSLLGACTLEPFVARCTVRAARAPWLRIMVIDATTRDRSVTTRVRVAPSLARIEVDAVYGHDARVIWWAELGVTMHTSESSSDVRLVSSEHGRALLENASPFVVMMLSDPLILIREHGAWTRARYGLVICGTGRPRQGEYVAPGARTTAAIDMLHVRWNDPIPDGPFRIEVRVAVMLEEGTVVSATEAETHTPTARVSERRLAVVETDALEGFVHSTVTPAPPP